MKINYSLALVGLISILGASQVLARGGGGRAGGGGDRGGGNFDRSDVSRPASNANVYRSPSMSRENINNVRNDTPSRQQLSDFLHTDSTLDANRTPLENAVSNNRLGTGDLFNNGFYQQHNLPYNYADGANLWRAANWNDLNGWLGWDAAAGVVDTDPSTTTTTTTAVPATTATTTTPVATSNNTTQSNSMPLGVFSMGGDAAQAANSSMYVQLGVNKNGEIQGVYYNTTTNQTQQVTGLIDKTTRQAAWQLADNANSPIMKTTLYNLTLDQFPVTVRFSNNGEQTWQLLRVKQS